VERIEEIRAFLNQRTSDLMDYDDILSALAEVAR
jgi:ATP synthase in type III secretion protein N